MVATATCTHHWRVEPVSRGGYFHAICRLCGTTGRFASDACEFVRTRVFFGSTQPRSPGRPRTNRWQLYAQLMAALSATEWQTSRQLIAAGVPVKQTWNLPDLAREGLVERDLPIEIRATGRLVKWRLV